MGFCSVLFYWRRKLIYWSITIYLFSTLVYLEKVRFGNFQRFNCGNLYCLINCGNLYCPWYIYEYINYYYIFKILTCISCYIKLTLKSWKRNVWCSSHFRTQKLFYNITHIWKKNVYTYVNCTKLFLIFYVSLTENGISFGWNLCIL